MGQAGLEMQFRLPLSSSHKIGPMLAELDKCKAELEIQQYGISVTTLEEVFLKIDDNRTETKIGADATELVGSTRIDVGADSNVALQGVEISLGETQSTLSDAAENGECKDGYTLLETVSTPIDEPKDRSLEAGDEVETTAAETFAPPPRELAHRGETWRAVALRAAGHLKALLYKRFLYGMRDRKMFIMQLLLPSLLVVFGLLLLRAEPSFDQPPLPLVPSKHYNLGLSEQYRNFVPFYSLGKYGDHILNIFDGRLLDATAIPINDNVEDQFNGCSQGAEPLFRMSNFLLKSQQDTDDDYYYMDDFVDEGGASRYGAVTIADNSTDSHLMYNVLINGSARHGPPIYVNLVHQAALKLSTGVAGAQIRVSNYPLPRTYRQKLSARTVDSFTAALFLAIAFCFIPASFAAFLVREREVGAKHQQLVSGVAGYSYWIANWIWDSASYMLTVLAVELALVEFSITLYTSGQTGWAALLLLIFFGPAAASFTYLLSFAFTNHSTAQTVIMFANFLVGLCFMCATFVMQAIPRTTALASRLRILFRIFPPFNLADGFARLSLCDVDSRCLLITEDGIDTTRIVSPFNYYVLGGDIMFLAIDAVVYFAITLIIEELQTRNIVHPIYYRIFSWLKSMGLDITSSSTSEARTADTRVLHAIVGDSVDATASQQRDGFGGAVEEDEDVVAEKVRVRCLLDATKSEGSNVPSVHPPDANPVITLYELRRVFFPSIFAQPKVAVQSLSFSVPSGECFGFLGVNGAGKSTTISILTGHTACSDGLAYVAGYDVRTQQANIRQNIGYCAQSDALFDLLTVEEHLKLYAMLKGVPKELIAGVVDSTLAQLNLLDSKKKSAGSLSGGNKRKLSLALALISKPAILFLDGNNIDLYINFDEFLSYYVNISSLCYVIEPSSGMDPASRRFMWKVLIYFNYLLFFRRNTRVNSPPLT